MATEPRTLEQYEKRYAYNTVIDGYGADTTTRFACPFCAASGWCAAKILEVEAVLQQEHTCVHCERSAKCIITRGDGGSMNMKLVQTGGDDPPEWLPPPEDRREG